MFDLNLIAGQRARKLQRMRLRRVTVYGLLVLSLGIAVMYGTMTVNTLILHSRIAEVNAGLDDSMFRAELKRFYTRETQLNTLRPRVSLLERVHDSEFAWLQVARDLAQVIPTDVWLTRMQSRRQDVQHTITLAGVAMTQRSVGDYMLALADAPWVHEADLAFTRRKTLGGNEVMEYELSLTLKTPVGSILE